jgi:hypothetical protein
VAEPQAGPSGRPPRFKKKGRCPERFRLTGTVRVEPDAVVLPRIGRVQTKEATGKFCGRILKAAAAGTPTAGMWQ